MKYLALLRDSFRESLDSKVIYFTFGLTVLLLLFVSSLGFRPVTVQEKLEKDLALRNAMRGRFGPKIGQMIPQMKVAEVVQTNEGVPPWQGDYRITLTMELPQGGEKADIDQAKAALAKLDKSVVTKGFPWLNIEDAKASLADDGRTVNWIITARGTKHDDERAWPHEPSLFFGAVPLFMLQSRLSEAVEFIELTLVNNLGGWVVVLLGVIVTAFFIPNMMQKGTIDLLLVKPIGRITLLVFKYLGGLAFVFINSLIAIGGTWLILGLKTGIWTYSFPLTILVLTFFFAVLYSVSALFGVLTRSSVLCIFMTCLVWFLLYILGQFHAVLNADLSAFTAPVPEAGAVATEESKKTVADSDPILRQVTDVLNVVHWILPRTNDLGYLTKKMISDELSPQEEVMTDEERLFQKQEMVGTEHYSWGESIGVSLAFIAVMLGLGCWRFGVRDY